METKREMGTEWQEQASESCRDSRAGQGDAPWARDGVGRRSRLRGLAAGWGIGPSYSCYIRQIKIQNFQSNFNFR